MFRSRMTDADHYRAEAQRCRDLAASSPDPEAARRWRAIAADYEGLAEAMENAPLIRRAGVQRQPMQQQQKKSAGDEGSS
jgi:hypothetical protein